MIPLSTIEEGVYILYTGRSYSYIHTFNPTQSFQYYINIIYKVFENFEVTHFKILKFIKIFFLSSNFAVLY